MYLADQFKPICDIIEKYSTLKVTKGVMTGVIVVVLLWLGTMVLTGQNSVDVKEYAHLSRHRQMTTAQGLGEVTNDL